MSDSKYTPEQLRAMANQTLEAIKNNDPKGTELIMYVSAIMGMNPDQVIHNIKMLAKAP